MTTVACPVPEELLSEDKAVRAAAQETLLAGLAGGDPEAQRTFNALISEADRSDGFHEALIGIGYDDDSAYNISLHTMLICSLREDGRLDETCFTCIGDSPAGAGYEQETAHSSVPTRSQRIQSALLRMRSERCIDELIAASPQRASEALSRASAADLPYARSFVQEKFFSVWPRIAELPDAPDGLVYSTVPMQLDEKLTPDEVAAFVEGYYPRMLAGLSAKAGATRILAIWALHSLFARMFHETPLIDSTRVSEAQTELERLARTDPDSAVRAAAIGALCGSNAYDTDSYALDKPRLRSLVRERIRDDASPDVRRMLYIGLVTLYEQNDHQWRAYAHATLERALQGLTEEDEDWEEVEHLLIFVEP